MRILVLILLLNFSLSSVAEESVVNVDLIFIADTGKESGNICFGEDEADCTTWSTFYLFDLKIEKKADTSFRVIYGQHALAQKDILGVNVHLKKLPLNNDFNADYQVVFIDR